MIRKIIVPVRGDGKGDNVLAHAAVLANRFSAHVEVLHCRPRPQDMLPYGIPVPGFLKEQLQDQAVELADEVARNLKGEFDTLMERFGLKVSDGPVKGQATATWVEESGRQVEVIKRHGRLADLIAVAQPEKSGMLGVNSLKAALFHTGRPAMMCPETETVPAALGSNIAIAWNGSTEVARAVALNMGLIESADTITILAGGDEIYGTRAEDLAAYLRIRGLESAIETFSAESDVGRELMNRAKAAGADLMIMGAYGDSHEKEIMFGGNTQTVVELADMPVVLVH
ncbi:MAG TPA: universal stress protein [Afifellaceae bacterium]|nr:universal stress protein [Afifellaceae bacterium]